MAMADAATTFTLHRQPFSHTTLHNSKSVSSAFSFSSSQLPPSRLCCNFSTALSNRSHHHRMRSFGCIASDMQFSSQQNSFAASAKLVVRALREIYATCRQWLWKGYSINYAVQGSGPPILLVHGFGASIGHWRRNIGVLAKSNTVYAIDLLGLGASEKPSKFQYTMEIWAELLVDFIKEVVGAPTVLIGNSIGSLACVIASAAAPSGLVRGTVLLNCSGGMNNKAISDDWRLQLASPLLWLIDFLLQRPYIATRLFNRVKSRDNLKTILQSIYSNKDAVDDELVEVILRPADTAGALDAFVSIITGPPGPKPMKLIPSISNPILVLWGDEDPFTPINGPVGKYFQALPQINPKVQLYLLQGVGHCPHDDSPDLVHEKLLPWLANL
ncbi:unnamed protein product [Sphagnum troendelagicum]|uniref:AB hydrolase-1 domain-containing protein n=1 Tax=Sphagnum troendelagicum TaxID=128251 RepID=A0ABP0T9A9_9BRYO